MDTANLLEQFESLGDSCEFGFVQRHFGIEPISLLRWSGSEINGLIRALEANFADLFQIENIRESGPGVVVDTRYGLNFHCSLRFAGERLDEEAVNIRRFQTYQANVHLRLRMFNETIGERGKIYVYKNNHGVSQRDLLRLKAALDLRGPQKLLCVVPACADLPPGQVELVASGVKLAGMARLAPYNDQPHIDPDGWLAVCVKAIEPDWGHQNAASISGVEGASNAAGNGLMIATDNGMVAADRDLAAALIATLYRAILLREPDSVGFKTHIEALFQGHLTLEQVVEAFLRSKEFARKKAAFLARYTDSPRM
jgi:hypothetical protein